MILQITLGPNTVWKYKLYRYALYNFSIATVVKIAMGKCRNGDGLLIKMASDLSVGWDDSTTSQRLNKLARCAPTGNWRRIGFIRVQTTTLTSPGKVPDLEQIQIWHLCSRSGTIYPTMHCTYTFKSLEKGALFSVTVGFNHYSRPNSQYMSACQLLAIVANYLVKTTNYPADGQPCYPGILVVYPKATGSACVLGHSYVNLIHGFHISQQTHTRWE